MFLEIVIDLHLGQTQQCGKALISGQIGQIVHPGEDAHPAEFADAGDEDKTQVLVERLDRRVKAFQPIPNCVGCGQVCDVVQNGFVVLVDEQDYLTLARKSEDQIDEEDVGRGRVERHAVLLGNLGQIELHTHFQLGHALDLKTAEIDLHHGMDVPGVVAAVDPQPLESGPVAPE